MSKKKLTLGKILNLTTELKAALKEKLSISIKWDISKILSQCEIEMVEYSKLREVVCKKHGELDESKQNYTFTDESQVEFSKEMEELNSQKVTLDVSLSFTRFDKIESEFPYHLINLLR
jgi:hypothetical protein